MMIWAPGGGGGVCRAGAAGFAEVAETADVADVADPSARAVEHATAIKNPTETAATIVRFRNIRKFPISKSIPQGHHTLHVQRIQLPPMQTVTKKNCPAGKTETD
jgi:hypothetical protein